MTGIQILNELITQRADAIRANQELVAWTLSPDAFMALKSQEHDTSNIAQLRERRDVMFFAGIPVHLNPTQREGSVIFFDERDLARALIRTSYNKAHDK